MSARDIVLRVEHLTMRFGGLVAVEDLSFTAARGEITALIGPNGAGKTTVFNCITSFYKPSEGRIALVHGDAAMWDELDALTQSGTRSDDQPDGLVAPSQGNAQTTRDGDLFVGGERCCTSRSSTPAVSSCSTRSSPHRGRHLPRVPAALEAL